MEWEWTAEQEALLGKVSDCCLVLCSLGLHRPLSTRRQVPARLSSMTARAPPPRQSCDTTQCEVRRRVGSVTLASNFLGALLCGPQLWDTNRIFTQTLDSLPAHLLTPFNGSAPPGNLLDKVAKRVIHAKNPMEWPHSIRATRAKLHKLARVRAEEASSRGGRNAGEYSHDVLQQTTNVQKKPLYRQSSMDFLRDNTLKDEKSLER